MLNDLCRKFKNKRKERKENAFFSAKKTLWGRFREFVHNQWDEFCKFVHNQWNKFCEFTKKKLTAIRGFSAQNNEYVKRTIHFVNETIQSKLVFIILVSIIWTRRVRQQVVDIDREAYEKELKNYAVLNTAVTGVLTFLLTMRLNNALSTNRAGFDRFGSTCGYLEIFYQRVLEKGVKDVPDLLIFIPFVIKHEMRKSFVAKECIIESTKSGKVFELVETFRNYDTKKESEYIQSAIKADFQEAGDEDVFRKIKEDLKDRNISDDEIRNKMRELNEKAKSDFI